MTQEAQEWQDELADIVTDSLDIDWNAKICAGHLLANGVYPPSVVAELVEAAQRIIDGGYVSQHIEEERADYDALTSAIAKLGASE